MKRSLLIFSMAIASMAHAQFSGTYAPANWSTTFQNTSNSNAAAFGSVNTSGAPNNIVITGPDGETSTYAHIHYSILVNQTGTISFNYATDNVDIGGPGFDYFFWSKNGVTVDSVRISTSGTASFAVTAGQTLTLGVVAEDDYGGPLTATISNFTTTSTALPVTGTDLSIKASGTANVLNWTTFSEQNNKGFEIQRSFDARTFSPIGFVPSQAVDGTAKTALDYTFTDKDAAQPVVYYRYRQIDHDGLENYSNVVIMKKAGAVTQTAWMVYPNPVNKGQALSLNNRSEGTLRLFDARGSLVHTQKVMKKASIQLPGHLAPGTYFSTLQTASGKQSATVVIQ